MQVSIDHHGQMLILPDTPLEAYALNKWTQDNIGNDPLGNAYFRSILIDCTAPHERPAPKVFTV